ncbi:hypothetical protein B0T16DRAFT_136062 [Cercophora newfieldiana]|uniref:Uncharacterized protein n=1 Tax=Cercophora newfieldiana TaxID=92897 RepID=A0AA40CUF4_9PEZI|nr:hypothetical protein B0T16DRAFT_136062 [Cercophora newfieldiana]
MGMPRQPPLFGSSRILLQVHSNSFAVCTWDWQRWVRCPRPAKRNPATKAYARMKPHNKPTSPPEKLYEEFFSLADQLSSPMASRFPLRGSPAVLFRPTPALTTGGIGLLDQWLSQHSQRPILGPAPNSTEMPCVALGPIGTHKPDT